MNAFFSSLPHRKAEHLPFFQATAMATTIAAAPSTLLIFCLLSLAFIHGGDCHGTKLLLVK